MTTIRKTIDINADTESVWKKISNVGDISKIIGFVQDSKMTGDARVCSLADGGILKEEIISIDKDLRRVVYSITESPLNMSFHVASMEVSPEGEGTRLTWISDLKPDVAGDHIEPLMEMACVDMKSTLAA